MAFNTNQPLLTQIFKEPAHLISYRKGKSLNKDMLIKCDICKKKVVKALNKTIAAKQESLKFIANCSRKRTSKEKTIGNKVSSFACQFKSSPVKSTFI